eukprot:6375811-Prymnesium_polylepis.1
MDARAGSSAGAPSRHEAATGTAGGRRAGAAGPLAAAPCWHSGTRCEGSAGSAEQVHDAAFATGMSGAPTTPRESGS